LPFLCPVCGHKTLNIDASFDLGPDGDSDSDENAIQVVGCAACGFQGIACYEESRRGALDSDSFRHTGYEVSAEIVARLVEDIGRGKPGPLEAYLEGDGPRRVFEMEI
jgi:uncharacterized Fe-S cluster-containing radical SAM superfamily enzyme